MNTDMKKQTAVEWFMEKIGEKQPNGMYVIDTLKDVHNVFEQAKAMEKEQIVDARQDGVDVVFKGYSISNEEYYNKIHGGDK
jgi:hypothetical protein